jgi:ribonuclease P/MRP protein subunit POP1
MDYRNFNIHPSASDMAFNFLKTLGDVSSFVVEKRDLIRFEFNGPRTNAILHNVLSPTASSPNLKLWETLESLTSTSSLPPGIVLSLEVFDPRVSRKRMPPRRADDSFATAQVESLEKVLLEWPHTNFPSVPFIPPPRKVSKCALDNPTVIPLILIQNGDNSPGRSKSPLKTKEMNCGFSLILPSTWAMPFWSSFILAGAKACAIKEQNSLYFESSLLIFPNDYPDTVAYQNYRDKIHYGMKTLYERKPKSKRVNYKVLGSEEPFVPSFRFLDSKEYHANGHCKMF